MCVCFYLLCGVNGAGLQSHQSDTSEGERRRREALSIDRKGGRRSWKAERMKEMRPEREREVELGLERNIKHLLQSFHLIDI